ncbi:VOC family protein [Henriciella aquimarina]|uniref:VOC family protein n=1 Tax=Henriciella aquimarina TaxID=545261 RepID=UPI000A019C26|nr:VOC family protein [Henriciella aquimarina]
MAISISTLRRVTCVVPDSGLAINYLENLFQARRLRNVPTHINSAMSLRLAHVGLGDLVIELVEPLSPNSFWKSRLEEDGAHVVSLAYGTDDMEQLIADLSAERLDLLEAENDAVWCKCRHITGFDLVLEPWNKNRPEQKPGGWGDVSPMLHVEITHPDIAEAGRWLEKLFGSQRVEKAFSEFLAGITAGRMDIKHFSLGDAVLQYIEPRHDAGPWWDLLQRAGPSVHNITWLVDDMPAVAKASDAAGTKDLRYFEFDYSPLFGEENRIGDKTVGRIIDCAHLLGFHLELSERQARNISDFMFKAV